MSQHAQGAERPHRFVGRLRIDFGKLGSKLVDERLLGIAGVQLRVLFPGLGLSRSDVLQAIVGVERQLAIALGRIAEPPALSDHLVDDVLLERGFFGVGVHFHISWYAFRSGR